MKYLARISYDGSKFMGFQRLKNGRGVQNELERVLSLLNGSPIKVHASGRTDIGVHAMDQCLHFELSITITLDKLKHACNRLLSSYVKVNSICYVDESFHARFSVQEKTYLYKVYLGKKDPFLFDYITFVPQKLDLKKMKQSCKLFVGTHDFHNFVSGYRADYQAIINSIKLFRKGKYLYFELKGKSFYRYMVRFIVGTLIMVGLDKISYNEIKEALDKPLERKNFFLAPPNGLYLQKIKFK